MNPTFDVFVNGLAGVLVGMAVLYLAMKLIAIFAAEPQGQDQRQEDKE